MQAPEMNMLLQESMRDFFRPQVLNKLAVDNKAAIEQAVKEERLPADIHAPTVDELEQMAEWMKEYKRLTPKASKRQIRKACQEHFNVRIFRKPYKSKTNF